MKRHARFLFVILLSVMVTSAFSQQGQRQQRTPEETATATVEWMKADLKLDDAKTKAVHAVVLKYAKQQAEMRQKLMSSDNREGIRETTGRQAAAMILNFVNPALIKSFDGYKRFFTYRLVRLV